MAVNPVMIVGGIALVGWLASMVGQQPVEAAPPEPPEPPQPPQPPEQPPTPGEPSARLSSESIEVSID